MRRMLAIVSLAVLAAACSGETRERAAVATDAGPGARAYQVGAFEAVTLAGPHDVIVTVGGEPSVRAEGEAEALDELRVEVKDGTLEIGNRSRGGISLGWGRGLDPVTVHVTVPSLREAKLAGSGTLRIDRVEGEAFDGALAGSGDLLVDALRVGRADFSIAGSGDIRAAGSAEQAEIGIAGSGGLDLSGLETRRARVNVMGSGDVRLRATETADVSIMGSGDVTIAGGARCTVSRAGSGEVHCEG